jgi:hypothetical protein
VARQLKVICTPIGFHDAYVATPSQKAALEGWGSDANLFPRGMAAIVTDPMLTKEPIIRLRIRRFNVRSFAGRRSSFALWYAAEVGRGERLDYAISARRQKEKARRG